MKKSFEEKPIVKTKFRVGEKVYVISCHPRACGRCESCGKNVEKDEYVVSEDTVEYVKTTIDIKSPLTVWYGVGDGCTPHEWIFKLSEKKKAERKCGRINKKLRGGSRDV